MHERAKRASASETYRPLFSHYGIYGAINDSIGQNTDIEKIYE